MSLGLDGALAEFGGFCSAGELWGMGTRDGG
jgi:hypothetical protein